jgi:uncharacterized protein GlcG (DUF336 family)
MHGGRRRRSRDDHAGELVEHLALARAWGAIDLALATSKLAQERNDPRLAVSRRTIERVMFDGAVPSARVKCAIALALDVAPWQLWGPGAMALPHMQVAT